MKKLNLFLALLICSLFFFSCKKQKYGSIELHFTHAVDENPVQFNQLIYTNEAGNQYQVNEIKYFISKIYFIAHDKKMIEVTQKQGIHYVDCSMEATLHWKINDIPQKDYHAISFVFGLNKEDNKSNRFVNPPESNFSWPNFLGGGYHYMQINGKFLNSTGNLQNMNIHTGIGQIKNENDSITQFVHNYFTVILPVNFSVNETHTTSLTLNMEVQRWFDTPNIYNFNEFGTGIMQNQRAQELLKENGWNVFTAK